MSGPNGRQKRAIENLAAALNECFDAAVEKSTQIAVEKSAQIAVEKSAQIAVEKSTQVAVEKSTQIAVEKSTQVAEQTRREIRGINARLDRQDETLHQQNDTLRMIWTQCGGKPSQRLPIDR